MSRILINDGKTLLETVILAETTAERLRGLLGRKSLPADTGMLIRPCRSIHMWSMRFPIDAAFLDERMQVIKIARNLRPWQLAFAPGKTASVLETAAGVMNAVKVGDTLSIT
ncbi:MAG: DUF192 domain-containing protein [Pontiella sp.]